MATSTALKAAKKALRMQMKDKLSSIPETSLIAQSERLLRTLQESPAYKSSDRISIYLSMPSGEIQTDSIVRSALSSGKKIFVPYMYSNPESLDQQPRKLMDMVALHDLDDYTALKPDSWGIPTVPKASISGRERILDGDRCNGGLDLVLLPGVAFEVFEGGVKRLGHGKGFYDYFLERHSKAFQANKVLLYGLALEEQLVEGETVVPTGSLDTVLRGVFAGNGLLLEYRQGCLI